MLRKVLLAISFAIVLGILAGGICFGQIKSGTITGRVSDSSGAVIPEAGVTVMNEETKVPTDTKTGPTGDYTVPYLQPGNYAVTITKEGFTTFTQTGIPVGVDITRRIDAQLAVGRTATVVEVKGAGAAALQTETSSVGDTVATDAIAALPNMSHNPYFFAVLQPQVTGRWELMDNNSPMSFGVGVYAHTQWSAFSMNGSAVFTTNVTLDGINIQGTAWNESDVSPNPDALQEVKTYTNNFDASIGRGQGAVAMVTRSGSNTFHGSAFGRVRNRAFNANTFSNDVTGDSQAQYNYKPISKPQFSAEYYGGTFGGPIKKDKAFFFASWQGMNHHTQVQQFLNVPMNNQAKGDFSSPAGCPTPAAATGTAAGNNMGTCVSVGGVATPIQLANPFVATPVAGASGVFLHPIVYGPNGMSDETQVADSHFLHYTSYYPKANKFPVDQYNNQNYFSAVPEIFTSNTVNSRVDVTHGKHNLYFTGGIEVGRINTTSAWGNLQPPFYYGPNGNSGQTPGVVYDHSPYGGIGDTITVSPTLVIDARMGVNRAHFINDEPKGAAFDHLAFGMPQNYIDILPLPTEAPETVDSPIGQWATLDSAGAQHKDSHETNWDYAVGVTKVKGKWTFKFGWEYMNDFTNTPDVFYSGGAMSKDGCGGCVYSDAADNSVSQNTTAAMQGITDEGDFMMGAAWWNFTPAQSYEPAYNEQYMGFYSANTWKVTSHLTLNLGLRWDWQPAVTERRNAMMSFDSADTNPLCSTATTVAAVQAAGLPSNWGCQGKFWMLGVQGHSRRMWATQYNNFGPRVGFAYRWHENTVIRGGYGLSYFPSNVAFNFGNGSYDEWPWGIGTTQNSQGANPAGAQFYTMENPNASIIVQPPGANPLAPQIYGIAGNITPYNYQNSVTHQTNLFVERKVGGWLLSVGYTGTWGMHLPMGNSFSANGENTTLLVSPWNNSSTNIMQCFHNGLQCPAWDSAAVSGKGYLQTGSDPYSQRVTNPFNPTGTLKFQSNYIAATIPRGLADGTYPLFSGFTPNMNLGSSTYNALQLEAKHQFGHGLMADIFYVWSKSLSNSYFLAEHNRSGDTDAASGQWNQIDLRTNRRLDIDDMNNRFVANIVYQLPFGTGHNLNPSNKVLSYAVGGWSIGATEMDQSGYPLDIYGNSSGALNARPNRAPNEPLILPKALQHWYDGKTSVTLPDGRIYTPCAYCFLRFNPDAFVQPVIASPTTAGKYLSDTYWLGNSAINYTNVRTPSLNNLNISLTRQFKLTERLSLELQANATNFLNHPNIQNYSTSLGNTQLTPNNSSNIPLGYSATVTNFGTHGLGTFDFRQIELSGRIKF